MRILVISEGVPSRIGGGRSRQFNLIKELAAQHRFSVVTFGNKLEETSAIEELRSFCEDVVILDRPNPPPIRSRTYYRITGWWQTLFKIKPRRGEWLITSQARRAVQGLINNQQFDLIQVHQGYMAPLLAGRVECATLLDMHDVLSDYEKLSFDSARGFGHRIGAYAEWQKMRRFERATMRRFNVCTVVSEQDRNSVSRLAPDVQTFLVPNGVDTLYFQPQGITPDPGLVLFVGSMNYPPNETGVLYFCTHIWPNVKASIPEARLRVVGTGPSERIWALHAHNGVEVAGQVPDVRPHLAQAAAVISPIYTASGTRLKILDAWAMEKAVVSTSLGAQGLAAEHLANIWLADSDMTFAQGVIKILEDPALRNRLAKAGRATVEQHYSWSQIAAQMQIAYEQALSRYSSIAKKKSES